MPLTFGGEAWEPYAGLAGLALPVQIETGSKKERMSFLEDLLFTHRGLSGPAVLQISSYWQPGTPLTHRFRAREPTSRTRSARPSSVRASGSATNWPRWCPRASPTPGSARTPPCSARSTRPPTARWRALAERIARWQITPSGTEGYKKAEVTAGGVDTRELSSQTMESKQPGLYFIGEVVDVTGWLGGYNFQWAWASAACCAQALALDTKADAIMSG